MIIDMFAHIRGPKYSAELEKRTGVVNIFPNPIRDTLDGRFAAIEAQYDGEYTSILSTMQENIPNPKDELALCQVANDEYVELCDKYPCFLGAAALLPTYDMKDAVKEAERAITQLKLNGLLLGTHVQGDLLGHEKMFELYDLAAEYDVPIWIHPFSRFPQVDMEPFSYSVETAKTMMSLSTCGVFEKHPNIKFITHHGGGVVPLMYPRMIAMYYAAGTGDKPASPTPPNGEAPPSHGPARPTWTKEEGMHYFGNLKKFYFDTAYDGVCSDAMMLRVQFFGIDKAVLSGDFPGGPTMETAIRDSVETIEGLPVSQEDKDKVYFGNAKKLLKLQ